LDDLIDSNVYFSTVVSVLYIM